MNKDNRCPEQSSKRIEPRGYTHLMIKGLNHSQKPVSIARLVAQLLHMCCLLEAQANKVGDIVEFLCLGVAHKAAYYSVV